MGKVDCSQSYGSCNLPATADPTTGNNFLLGTFPIPLPKICWHVGQVREKENQSLGNNIIIQNIHSFFISPKDVTLSFQVLSWAGELEWWVTLGQVFVCRVHRGHSEDLQDEG